MDSAWIMSGFWLWLLLAPTASGGAQTVQKESVMSQGTQTALKRLAAEMVESAKVEPGGEIPGWKNTTGYTLRLPGGNRGYPAFWVRDAAMMLGADLISATEVEGWIRLIASVQAGPEPIRLKNGLLVPPYSIPDHITLRGAACWYPGAMDGEDQGDGTFGFLPPADDAFYFLQMVREHMRLTGKPGLFQAKVRTVYGERPLSEVCDRAFDSVATDAQGLVICEAEPGRTRVDWGFCDTVRKTGACLMPSLLRWRAAHDMAALWRAAGDAERAGRYAREADRIQAAIPKVFAAPGAEPRLLFSATGIGREEDVWASGFAVWLGALPPDLERRVCARLAILAREGGTFLDGQARALPAGRFWEQCVAAPGTYQNGAFWGTPSGWIIAALHKTDRKIAEDMLNAFMAHMQANREKGAPWECFNPEKQHYQNPLYCATVALPYIALTTPGKPD
jgi:hypothetical protein